MAGLSGRGPTVAAARWWGRPRIRQSLCAFGVTGPAHVAHWYIQFLLSCECVTKLAPDPPKIRGPRDMRAIQPCALLREPEKWGRKRRTKRRQTALGRRAGERKSA